VCNIACSSPEAYVAHIRGQKHQKTIKLWASLGKPIPDSLKPQVVKVIPKTNFTVGGTLNTLTGKMEPTSDRPQTSHDPIIPVAAPPVKEEKPMVGLECVTEERDKHGKLLNYRCTICECDMNNRYMRDDHCKGRKHLTEYKLKINPHFKVADKKLSQAFQQIEQIRIQAEQQEMIRREHREQGMRNKINQRERELLSQYPGFVQTSSVPSVNDNIIFRKHNDICPTPDEIQWADKFLAVIESALKLVSESLVRESGNNKEKDLKAVMRIGNFAKGVSLRGEKEFDLVVLCAKKPDQKLIMSIHTLVSEKIPEVNIFQNEEFEVTLRIKECAIKITAKHLGYTCDVHITSPAVREDPDPATDPPKVLDKDVCNRSLAEMRRAKWFDSKSKLNSSLIVVVRCLRDLKRRIPTWEVFPVYVIELLCDKALRTVAHEMGAGELLRRFFELVSSGVLLVGDNGVYDPCEKNNVNAAGSVDQQDCQDITTSAQHALRLIALNQMEKVLGLKAIQKVNPPLPPQKTQQKQQQQAPLPQNNLAPPVNSNVAPFQPLTSFSGSVAVPEAETQPPKQLENGDGGVNDLEPQSDEVMNGGQDLDLRAEVTQVKTEPLQPPPAPPVFDTNSQSATDSNDANDTEVPSKRFRYDQRE